MKCTGPTAAHRVCFFYGRALNANLPLAVSLLLLKGSRADLACQDLSPDEVPLGQAQADLPPACRH